MEQDETQNTEQTSGGSRPLLRLFVVLFIELIGLGMVIPALPFFAENQGADAFLVGLLFALQYAGQFVTAPLWGSLSDKLGRKPVMSMTLFAAALASLCTALAPSLLWLFLARLFAGVASGNISTASAYITDVTDESSRSKGMAVIGISFGLGFTIGPGLGAWLSSYSLELPFYIAVGISAFNAIFAYLLLREPVKDEAARAAHRNARKSSLALLQNPDTRIMCILNLWFTVALSFLEVPFAFYLLDIFEKDTTYYGGIMATLGVVMILVQGGLVGRVSKKMGDLKMSMVGMILLAFGLVLAPIFVSLPWLVATLSLASVGRGLLQPGILALVSKTGGSGNSGQVMGVFQSASSLGRVFGPALGGAIYAYVAPQAPFWSAGGILLLAFLYWRFNLRTSHTDKSTVEG